MKQPTRLFEASWEVCNKVGGIYTVLTSKMPWANAEFPDGYYAVGPYLSQGTPPPEFEEQPLPPDLRAVAERASEHGVTIHYGTWAIATAPPTLLIAWDGLVPQLDGLKSLLWEKLQLDTLNSDFYDVDQPLMWGIAISIVVAAYAEQYPDRPVLLHAHEWMTGGSILHLAATGNKTVRTVFTTHATVLGRSLSGNFEGIHDIASADQVARTHGVLAKHQIERLSASLSTVFTTVSQLTAGETGLVLGRQPDLVTENGLSSEQFPLFDELCIQRQHIREELDAFIAAYFFPYYHIDLSKASYQFTMGRYEPRNKGYDLYLRSLGLLNNHLKAARSDRTVVAFILVPADHGPARPDLLTQVAAYAQAKRLHIQEGRAARPDWYWQATHNLRDIPSAPHRQLPGYLLSHLPDSGLPPLSAFELKQGNNDAILQLALQAGLTNAKDDRVKVVYLPVYLDGFDGLLNIPLYDLLPAFDLGVFPSLYEPWGYTPMESLAAGIPAITSTFAGFGIALQPVKYPENSGHFILDRNGNDDEDADQLLEYLEKSLEESPRSWLGRRMAAYTTAQMFDWQRLYLNYQRVYAQAQRGLQGAQEAEAAEPQAKTQVDPQTEAAVLRPDAPLSTAPLSDAIQPKTPEAHPTPSADIATPAS